MPGRPPDEEPGRKRSSGSRRDDDTGRSAAPGAGGGPRRSDGGGRGSAPGGGRRGEDGPRGRAGSGGRGQPRSDDARGRPAREGDRSGGGRGGGGDGRDRPNRARSAGPEQAGRGDGPRELPAGGRGWGGLARKGTRNLGDRKWEGADHADRPEPAPPEAWEPERWVEEPRRPDPPVPPGRRRPPRPLPPPVSDELAGAAGAARAAKLAGKLSDGVRAFERDHFQEARQLLQPVADEAPTAASVRELLGLTYYRLGQWRQAVRELDAYAELSSSTSSHPVLADANRALGRHDRVEELWEEMRLASHDPSTVAEGRIVAAGSLADRGRLVEAIALLEQGRLSAKHPEDHHLRLWYALADLYERAGEVPRARDLFERVARHDPEFVDVVARRRALG